MIVKIVSMNKQFRKLLKNRASFTSKEAKTFGISASQLAYYVNIGILERISRGLYRNPRNDLQVPTPWEDLVATVKSIPKGVICLVSALNIYEMTDEFPREHWIAIPNNVWPKKRNHTKIMRLSNMALGKIKIKLGKESVWIFDQERTVIDSFRFLSREIAIKALKIYLQKTPTHNPNFKKLSRYSEKLRYDISPYTEAITT